MSEANFYSPFRPEREADCSRPSRGWIYRHVVHGCLLLSCAEVGNEWNFILTAPSSLQVFILVHSLEQKSVGPDISLSPTQAVTCGTVAIIIRVVLLSAY